MVACAAEGYYCHGDNQAKLGEDTDDDDDHFTSDVEADLEEDGAVMDDEAIISTLASHFCKYAQTVC